MADNDLPEAGIDPRREAVNQAISRYEAIEGRDDRSDQAPPSIADPTVSPAAMPDDLTDAKIAASEARTDTKFARLEGKLDTLAVTLQQSIGTLSASVAQQRAEALSNRTAIITTVVAVGFALAALLLAVMAYGDSVFSRGMSVRDVVDAAVHDSLKAKGQ